MQRARDLTRRRSGLGVALLLAILALPLPASVAPGIGVEQADLTVQLDPSGQALYAKANLVIRNQSRAPTDVVEFFFLPPLSAGAEVSRVWDYDGQLAWRSDPVEENQPRLLQVALRKPLDPGKKTRLVVSFQVHFPEKSASEALTVVDNSGARLAATGWYPLPGDSQPPAPRSLRLTVRVPNEWEVSAPGKLKRGPKGTALTSYEVKVDGAPADAVVLRAEPRAAPSSSSKRSAQD